MMVVSQRCLLVVDCRSQCNVLVTPRWPGRLRQLDNLVYVRWSSSNQLPRSRLRCLGPRTKCYQLLHYNDLILFSNYSSSIIRYQSRRKRCWGSLLLLLVLEVVEIRSFVPKKMPGWWGRRSPQSGGFPSRQSRSTFVSLSWLRKPSLRLVTVFPSYW